jgi:hypothetical protein
MIYSRGKEEGTEQRDLEFGRGANENRAEPS